MTIDQHKIILEEILRNKPALSLIRSPNMKTYILGKVIEDLKRKHKEKTCHQVQSMDVNVN